MSGGKGDNDEKCENARFLLLLHSGMCRKQQEQIKPAKASPLVFSPITNQPRLSHLCHLDCTFLHLDLRLKRILRPNTF